MKETPSAIVFISSRASFDATGPFSRSFHFPSFVFYLHPLLLQRMSSVLRGLADVVFPSQNDYFICELT